MANGRKRWITAGVAGIAITTSLTGCLNGEVVSRASGGPPADAASRTSGISRTGRFVAFVSSATNLVPGDTNGWDDLFVRDNVTGDVRLVSLEADGTQLDMAGVTDGWISSDGNRIAFRTTEKATADDTDALADVFSRDLTTGATVRVTVQPAGVADETWSGNPSKRGDLMVFAGASANYLFDLATGATATLPGTKLDGPRISDDGTVVAGYMVHVVSGVGPALHVSFKDAASGTVEQGVVVSTDQSLPSGPYLRFDMTPDGRYVGVTFMAISAGLEAVAGRYDRVTGARVSAPGLSAGYAELAFQFGTTLSDDGRYMAYSRAIMNRFGDFSSDFSVYDTAMSSAVTRVGSAGLNTMPLASISGDGRWVAFETAEKVGAGDTNGLLDVVVMYGHEPVVHTTTPPTIGPGTHTVTLSATGTLGLTGATVSGDGVVVTGVRVTSPTTAEIDVVVAAGTTPGMRDLTLRNRGDWPGRPMVGATGGCTACLTITG